MNQTTDPLDAPAIADALFTVNFTPEQIERFWSKVNKTDGCWDWMFGVDTKGYGKIGIKYAGTKITRMLAAHRVSFFLTFGSFPLKMSVLHKCDRPRCCNPEHLFLGTQLDNMRDMDAKGRRCILRPNRTMGERVNTAKLTPEEVKEIRKLSKEGHTTNQLSLSYGVSNLNIRSIVRGVTWKHLL